MYKVLDYLIKVDFLGGEIGFEYQGTRKFKTFIGAVLSSIIFITVVIFGVVLGQEIYKRKRPLVSNSNTFLEESTYSYNDFPILYSFFNYAGKEINPHEYFDFLIQEFSFDENLNLNITNSFSLVNCSEIKSNFNTKSFFDSDLLINPYTTQYCPNFPSDSRIRMNLEVLILPSIEYSLNITNLQPDQTVIVKKI